MVREIATWLRRIMIKTGEARVNLPGQVLFGAPGEKARMQGFERAIIGNAQRRGVVLPLTAQKRMQQRPQLYRCNLGQLQRVMLLSALQRGFHHFITQRLWRCVKRQASAFAAPGLCLPTEPTGFLRLAQQRTHMSFAAKTEGSEFGNGDLLRFPLRRLPQTLKLI